jgi:hypothetical protein
MKIPVLLAAICLLHASTAPASEYNNFRCGAEVVSLGDFTGKVFMECGEPSWKESVGYTDGLLENQVWYYNCGTDDFLYVLRFVGGRLKKIESQGYGSGSSDCCGPRNR